MPVGFNKLIKSNALKRYRSAKKRKNYESRESSQIDSRDS